MKITETIKKTAFIWAVVAVMTPVIMPENLQAENLSSRWIIDQYTKSRLFVGGYDAQKKLLRLGWQVNLKAGWKTYWRSPGDAGLPPRWTWGDNRNIRHIAVSWPEPKLLNIFDMDTYIYDHQVILPIDVAVSDMDKPTFIALDLEYMICEDICIPKEGRYHLEIPAFQDIEVSLFQKALLERYTGLVPVRISGEDTVVRVDDARKDTLLIHLAENIANVEDIIIEGPEGMMFGRASAEGNNRFSVPYNAPQPLEGVTLTLTLLGGAGEMEVTVQP